MASRPNVWTCCLPPRRISRPATQIEHWGAVGYLNDYDYQHFPEGHLKHTEAELLAEGVDAVDVRATACQNKCVYAMLLA